VTERIVAAALRIKNVTISDLPPARHHTLLYAYHAAGCTELIQPEEQGFLTNTGRFVSREEALKIALAAKQISAPRFNAYQLFSEDLW
jgi:hypothetical protein